MGEVRLISTLFDMASLEPAPSLATTKNALRGKSAILILAPDGSRFNVDLESMPGQFRLQWFDTVTGAVSEGGSIEGGKTVLLRSPSSGAAVLYLRSASSSWGPSLASIAKQVQSIRQASMRYATWPMRFRSIAKPYLDILSNSYHAMLLSLFTSAGAGFALGFGGGWALAYHSSK
jgi:hypothetical protein